MSTSHCLFIGSRLLAAGLLLSTVFCRTGLAASDDADFLSRVKTDTQWLNDYGSRQLGTASHQKLQDDLLAKVRALPNATVWVDEYPVVVPVNDETHVQVTGGDMAGRHDIYPIWPDVGRLNTTPVEGIRGKLIYIGQAEYDQIPAKSLRGNIAVMEMSAYKQHRRAFDYGATAIIFLQSTEPGEPLPSQQSLYKPRYFVPAGPLADALRAGKCPSGTIISKQHWGTVTARNIYVGIQPKDAGGTPAYAVAAPYDSMSRVMGVAPGADAALDCALALNLLREEAKNPRRTLLFGFVDAYHINQLGVRRMAAMLTVTPGGWTRTAYNKIEQASLEEYRKTAEELEPYHTPQAGLVALRAQTNTERIRRIYKDLMGKAILRLQDTKGELRLASLRTQDENTPATRYQMLRALIDGVDYLLANFSNELTAEQREQLKVSRAFAVSQIAPAEQSDSVLRQKWTGMEETKAQARKVLEVCKFPLEARNQILNSLLVGDGDILTAAMPVAIAVWNDMTQQVREQLKEEESRANYFKPLDELRQTIAQQFGLDANGEDQPACTFLVGLDISDCGVLVGPGLHDNYLRIDPTDPVFLRSLKLAVKKGDIWPQQSPTRRFVDIGAIEGRAGKTGAVGERALITGAATSFLLPGVTWTTVDAPRQRIDSPLDVYDALDWDRIAPQLPPTRELLDWLFTTKDFVSNPKTPEQAEAKWRNGMGSIVDISQGETVPRVPRRGFLVTLVGYAGDVDGIRRHEFTWTAYDGQFRLPLLCADVHNQLKNFILHAYNLDPTGAIVESVSTTESLVTTHLATSFSLANKPGEQLPRAVTFRCTELNGPSFYDARFLEPLTEASLLDAVRGGAPKQSVFNMDKTGQMWGLVSPGTRWQLLVRAGATGVRMALLNAVKDARKLKLDEREAFQRGFPVERPLSAIATYLSAQDFYALDQWRLTDFRAAGIRSDKIDEIREATLTDLNNAAAAVEADDGAALQRASVMAMANEIRAYRAIKETGQDVARGAIFLMLMLLPFSVALERLVFAAAKIGNQIAGAVIIFAAMTLLLWSFHPAFQISAQPLVIVMAFIILAMSMAVISMILSRFRAAVREFQSHMAEGSGAQMGRGGLLGSAVFLGIANMRKRKMRTALTGTTIMLVTFALLCFSSTSSYVDKKEFRIDGVKADHASVLIRRPSFGPIDWGAVEGIENLVGRGDVTMGPRTWLTPGLGQTDFRVWLINPATGEQVGMYGALGLPANEDRMSGVDSVLTDWQTFATDGGCYLPIDTAKQLAVKVGDPVVVKGQTVIVRGVFDPITLEDKLTLLDGQRILPYDYSRQEQDWINRDSQSAIEQETESASAMQPPGNNADRYLPAREVVILPAKLLYKLGGDLRSIGLSCQSIEQSTEVAHNLMRTIVYPAYFANTAGGVSVVVATPLISVPPKNLAIPLVIAALIIFTTMLNSVSERKKEIYVYSSLGLAPVHIGAMFIAEALTYGLMGAVFGYVAGQGFATLLTHMGWMHGVTLNYSGTSVIKTMFLVQLVVVMAAFVPAIMAGRIASPSSEMDWKVPQPVDGVIRDILPFTVSPSAATGLVAFIHEYIEAHRDGVLGRFDVDDVQLLQAGKDDYLAGLEARVWLAPFDMGVCQRIRLTVEPPQDDVCAIAVRIEYETGTPKVWWRLNKPFFYELRRQMLGWRKVTPERMREYSNRIDKIASEGVSS